MGDAEATQFLTTLANERRVSVSPHNQALSALLFLYREVLAIDLPWLTEVQRPTRPKQILSALTKAKFAALSGAMGTIRLCWPSCCMTRLTRGMRSAAWCDKCRLPLYSNRRKYPCSCRAAPQGTRPAYQRVPLTRNLCPNRRSRFRNLECPSPNWDLSPIQPGHRQGWRVGTRRFLGFNVRRRGPTAQTLPIKISGTALLQSNRSTR
ncbi:phage integrase N-terminal SAM-like domain-containing protein [Polaromonas sp.]|uniref:phage integrase N-terminal SAM-like domain-containing protein n=1 Tax=Polaromonas sp. TaxID=1869339 RepID=UPI0034566BA2